jgi:hypothetical protein
VHKLIALVGILVLGVSLQAYAGTQDFTLVNKTGVEINNLHVSESGNDDWEEDVLGADTLAHGDSLEINFDGREDCLWDLMVKDDEGNGVYWRKIDLCEASEVTLSCKNGANCSASVQ